MFSGDFRKGDPLGDEADSPIILHGHETDGLGQTADVGGRGVQIQRPVRRENDPDPCVKKPEAPLLPLEPLLIAPLEEPELDADLVYESLDVGWPGYEERTYTYQSNQIPIGGIRQGSASDRGSKPHFLAFHPRRST